MTEIEMSDFAVTHEMLSPLSYAELVNLRTRILNGADALHMALRLATQYTGDETGYESEIAALHEADTIADDIREIMEMVAS